MATEMPITDRCNGPHEGARLCACGWRPGYGVWGPKPPKTNGLTARPKSPATTHPPSGASEEKR